MRSQDSYLSVSDFRLHFGLGRATRADLVRVEWPNSKPEEILNVDADQLIRVEEEGESSRARDSRRLWRELLLASLSLGIRKQVGPRASGTRGP